MHIAAVEKASTGMSDGLVNLNKHKMDIGSWASSSRGHGCEKMLDLLSLAALGGTSDVVTCTFSRATLCMSNMANCDPLVWRAIFLYWVLNLQVSVLIVIADYSV